MSLIKEAKQSLLWTFLHQSSTKLIGFIIQIILARILEPTDYGLIGMITVFIAIGQTLIDGGMTTSLIRTKDISDTDYSTVFTFNIFFSVLVYLVIFCIAPFVSSFLANRHLPIS